MTILEHRYINIYVYTTIDFLRAPQEVRSRVDAARDPPRRDAHVGVVRRQVHARRTLHVLRAAQHVRAHHHVHLLHAGRHGAAHETLPLVEEIPHHPADGQYSIDAILMRL